MQIVSSVRHEFGHLVIAKVVGFSTGDIKLKTSQAGAQVDLLPTFSTLANVQDYCERRIKVLYAGPCAEALNGGRVDLNAGRRLLMTTSANDHAKIRELTRIICGVTCPSIKDVAEFAHQLKEIDNALAEETVRMVEQDASLIKNLTVFFMKKLDEEERRLGHQPIEFIMPRDAIDAFPGVTSRFP
jgi:hypothetical protein